MPFVHCFNFATRLTSQDEIHFMYVIIVFFVFLLQNPNRLEFAPSDISLTGDGILSSFVDQSRRKFNKGIGLCLTELMFISL